MTDTQPSDTDARAVTDGPPFRFMDLPAEIREMIYRHAMRKEGVMNRGVISTKHSFPSLLSVCSQIRKEASPVYFRVTEFALELQPQPHTETTVLAFNRRTRDWFDLIGADRINDLRYVVFVFHNAEDQIQSIRLCVVDLWSQDASQWEFMMKGDKEGTTKHCTLRNRIERIKKTWSEVYKGAPSLGPARKEEMIQEHEVAIQRGQDALDQFHDMCVEDKRVKPTVDGLGIIGRAMDASMFPRPQQPPT